ncbi:hypothetical protein, partial [Zoogloea sp.]|uniref:hypothetical protein n=1 Tax=Zoogloea sp. TaxID=49181 RepID=UPI002D1FA2DC
MRSLFKGSLTPHVLIGQRLEIAVQHQTAVCCDFWALLGKGMITQSRIIAGRDQSKVADIVQQSVTRDAPMKYLPSKHAVPQLDQFGDVVHIASDDNLAVVDSPAWVKRAARQRQPVGPANGDMCVCWLPQFRAPDALRDTVKQDCAIIAKI